MSEQTVEKPYELFSFIDYMKSGTQLNNEREVFVANAARAQGVSSQQARIDKLTKETWDLGTERDELKARIRELEAELEARKKAWEEVRDWATDTRNGAIKETGTALYFNEFVEKLTAIETTLPKGGA